MLKFIVLGIGIVAVIFFFDVLLPKLKFKYKRYIEQKRKRQRREAFRRKMDELEIK